MHPALVGKGRPPHIGEGGGQTEIEDIRHPTGGRRPGPQALRGDQLPPLFQLEGGDQGREIAVAAPLPEAQKGALHLDRPGLQPGQRAGLGHPHVVVTVHAQRKIGQGLSRRPHARRDLLGKAPPVGVAQAAKIRARLRGRLQTGQRVIGIGLPAVEEVFGVEDHPPAGCLQPGHRIGDHGQIFLRLRAQHRPHLKVPALAEQGDRWGAGRDQGGQAGVFVGGPLPFAGAAEGDQPAEEIGALGGLGKKSGVLGVGGGVSGLDQGDAQLAQGLGNGKFVPQGEVHALALAAVPQGGVQHFDAHNVGSGRFRRQENPGCPGFCGRGIPPFRLGEKISPAPRPARSRPRRR